MAMTASAKQAAQIRAQGVEKVHGLMRQSQMDPTADITEHIRKLELELSWQFGETDRTEQQNAQKYTSQSLSLQRFLSTPLSLARSLSLSDSLLVSLSLFSSHFIVMLNSLSFSGALVSHTPISSHAHAPHIWVRVG